MIWKNFVRDLYHMVPRLTSVSVIIMIVVMVHTALSGILTNTEHIFTSYLGRQNVTDYWLTGVSLGQEDCRTLESIAGVTGMQPRVVLDAGGRRDSGVALQLCAVPGNYVINTLYVVEDHLSESSREIVLNNTLARAQGLHPGNQYELTLTGTGQYLWVRTNGLVKDPERPYYVSTTTPALDLTHYVFVHGNKTPLRELMGAGRYNQICVTTDRNPSTVRLRLAVDMALEGRTVNILSLEDNTQAHYLLEMRGSLTPIPNIFPVLFFLYTVLMIVDTVNRSVENARSDIGTFKALGYSDVKVMCYYLLRVPPVAVVGFPVGAWLGQYVSILIVSTIVTGCDLLPYTVVHDLVAWGQVLGLTVLCCIGSAWLVIHSLLKETPVQYVQPKPSRSTKPVALERFGLVWHRMGFNRKYITRNTLRNKVCMAIRILDITLCMVLTFLVFALWDSIQVYSGVPTERQGRYDLMVDLSISMVEGQYWRLANGVGVTEAELGVGAVCWLYTDSQWATTALTVTEDQTSLERYDPYTEGVLTPPGNGLVLKESLANELELRAGDRVMLRFVGSGRYYSVLVAEVNRCTSGACLSRSLWRGLGLAYMPTAVYLTGDGPGAPAARLGDYDLVDAWQTRQAATTAAMERLSNMSMVVYILVLLGGGLICVVIYNLGIMSFFEQLRSLVALIVLGFYKERIKTPQLSENTIFTVCGILLDTPLGVSLNHMILTSITTMPLVEAIRPASLALPCAVALPFILAVNVMIGRKMQETDMLGAFKSVE